MGRAPQQHYEMRTTDTEWQELARTMQGNGNPPHQEYPIVTERQNWNRQKKRKKIIPQCRIDAKVFSITWWKHNVCWCICTWILYKSQTGLNLRGWFVGERWMRRMHKKIVIYVVTFIILQNRLDDFEVAFVSLNNTRHAVVGLCVSKAATSAKILSINFLSLD